MSRAFVRLALTAAVLAAAGFLGRAAWADAASIDDLLAGGLIPSSAPAMLGPITSAGRKGWECQPERAAASPNWQTGDLPAAPAGH